MITNITITGSDDSIKPSELIELSKRYSFVEWGILISNDNFDECRFPSMLWLKELYNIKQENPDIKLSCHLCGKYVEKLINGDDSVIRELYEIWDMFERVQLNFHELYHVYSYDMINILLKYPEKEFVFQFDGVNEDIFYICHNAGVNCSVLFDKSSGTGLLPIIWPKPLDGIKCGFSGGLSIENIENQILLIEVKTKDIKTWIDIETHVRSKDDLLFELDKVESCLKIVDKHINK